MSDMLAQFFPPRPSMTPKDPEGIIETIYGPFTKKEVRDFLGIVSQWHSSPSSLGPNEVREAMRVAQSMGVAERFRRWLRTENIPTSTHYVLCDDYNDDGSAIIR